MQNRWLTGHIAKDNPYTHAMQPASKSHANSKLVNNGQNDYWNVFRCRLERFPFNSSLHPYSMVIPAKAGIYKRLLDAALE